MIKWTRSSKESTIEERNRVSSYRGYLYKMRRSHNMLAPQWGKRWFSIEGKFLRWYRQESDLNPSGTINLKNVRSITKVEISGCFTFCVTSEDRNLIMRAMTMTEMNNWIRSLHIHADIARGGSGMNVVSDFNEVPLRATGLLSSKRGAKLRSSLSLQQEIDLNLRKLTELEKELQKEHSGSQDNQDSDNERRRRQDSRDRRSRRKSLDNSDDENYRYKDRNGQSRTSESNLLCGRNPILDTNNPGEEDDGVDDMPHIKKSSALYAAKKAMKRIESADSIEDITHTMPATRTPRRQSSKLKDRQLEREQSNKQNDAAFHINGLTDQSQKARRVEVDPDIIAAESDEDEFDFENKGKNQLNKRDNKKSDYNDFEIMSLSTDTADNIIDNKSNNNNYSSKFGSNHKRVPLIESLDSLDSVDLPIPKTSKESKTTSSDLTTLGSIEESKANKARNNKMNEKSRLQKEALLESRSSHSRGPKSLKSAWAD